jgi:hypothetical protein
MPLPKVPDWLQNREGSLKAGVRDYVVLVMLGGQPDYRLEARPAAGAYSCFVTQTINNKRLDGGKVYPSLDAALTGGLDELRDRLGW